MKKYWYIIIAIIILAIIAYFFFTRTKKDTPLDADIQQDIITTSVINNEVNDTENNSTEDVDNMSQLAASMGMSIAVYGAWLNEVEYARDAINNNASFGAFKKAGIIDILDKESKNKAFAELMVQKAKQMSRRLGSQIYVDAIWLYNNK